MIIPKEPNIQDNYITVSSPIEPAHNLDHQDMLSQHFNNTVGHAFPHKELCRHIGQLHMTNSEFFPLRPRSSEQQIGSWINKSRLIVTLGAHWIASSTSIWLHPHKDSIYSGFSVRVSSKINTTKQEALYVATDMYVTAAIQQATVR